MTRLLALSTAVALFATLAATDANAWERNSTTTGSYGRTFSTHATGSCYGGTCSRSVTRTGPYGGTATTNGAVNCYGGACNYGRTTTGAYGRSVTTHGTITRY
ncbi:hypothetical protein HDIA_0863 [Hartmannibacter diazotrophicus]|uniref:Uncharacterized protein n=1 Tax=Hartmannibacter diazotrophicus TaxID=1482074 RepID=A0A2C9D2C4_9HYPH|nr:hypothetical protein [Hartmannibacter diazotrophicus]SON54404.1 hypothetical protein HDIA_0863 [Hartmannibacter diazotrophicus]